MTRSVSTAEFTNWTEDPAGPVALYLHQPLQPVDGPDGVFFPPTYAGIGYNISTLTDGSRVAEVDSVGSQANRIEPLFKLPPRDELVPQIFIRYAEDREPLSLLDAGHRLGDAVVRCTELGREANAAFQALLQSNDATAIAKLSPTSLVFGAWDSRDTQAKLPRIVQSVIRAMDVSELQRSAQFIPAIDPAVLVELDVFTEADRVKDEKSGKGQLAERGYVHVPSTGNHGGIIAHGGVDRRLTLNLVQVRRLGKGEALRQYVLGLSLAAAMAPQDAFLRAGCLLTPDPERPSRWDIVSRDGSRETVTLSEDVVMDFAGKAAAAFGVGTSRTVVLEKALAKADAGKKTGKKAGTKKAETKA